MKVFVDVLENWFGCVTRKTRPSNQYHASFYSIKCIFAPETLTTSKALISLCVKLLNFQRKMAEKWKISEINRFIHQNGFFVVKFVQVHKNDIVLRKNAFRKSIRVAVFRFFFLRKCKSWLLTARRFHLMLNFPWK